MGCSLNSSYFRTSSVGPLLRLFFDPSSCTAYLGNSKLTRTNRTRITHSSKTATSGTGVAWFSRHSPKHRSRHVQKHFLSHTSERTLSDPANCPKWQWILPYIFGLHSATWKTDQWIKICKCRSMVWVRQGLMAAIQYPSALDSSITRLLVTTKQLLQGLDQWSHGLISEIDVRLLFLA